MNCHLTATLVTASILKQLFRNSLCKFETQSAKTRFADKLTDILSKNLCLKCLICKVILQMMLIFIGIHININDIHFTTRSIPYVFLKSKLRICIVQVICSTMHYWLTRGSIVYRVIISLWSAYRLLQMSSLTSQRKNPIVALSCMWRNYKRPINNCLREIGKVPIKEIQCW